MKAKPFQISKMDFMEAFRRVKENKGGAGIDGITIEIFEKNLKDNLFVLWNRMSSGSYIPPAVKGVSIPKKAGGTRTLGIPTVPDRIGQMVVAKHLERILDPCFHRDSYGYRPGKSALDAIGITRSRCWKFDWVLEFDIRGLFDNIDHELLLKAVRHHTDCKWVLLYVERWLKAPMKMEDGTFIPRTKGTPQGGVVSPILSNLFLHYTFDKWMERNFKENSFCRYADDGLVHAKTCEEAFKIKTELEIRFKECGLEMHPTKTKIVYCKDANRKGSFEHERFEFLGYTFKTLTVQNRKTGELFRSFQPIASMDALKGMANAIKFEWKMHLRTDLSLFQLARKFNPVIRGWINYYGQFNKWGLVALKKLINFRLIRWAHRKYKSIRAHKRRQWNFLNKIIKQSPNLFAHWKMERVG